MPEQTSAAIQETRPNATRVIVDPQNGFSRTAPDLPPGMSNNTNVPPTNGSGGTTVPQTAGGQSTGTTGQAGGADAWCLQKALDIYQNGRNYMDSNITLQWERNLYHFRSEHGPGTPYARSDWRRSRTFRPKTRANVKAQEAAHAAAAFSTQDYLDVQPFDQTDERQVISAHVSKALVQYRLRTVPWNWFMTAQGAYQDTKNYGICISHQYWKFEQVEEVVPAIDDNGQPIMGADEGGNTVPMGTSKTRVITDMPVVDLIAPECFLFDPMCDWRNPTQSSPVLCYMMPMYAGEALEMMEKQDPKTGAKIWRKYPLQTLLATKRENVDNRTRRAREGHKRIDPSLEKASPEYTTIWAHLNIAREGGVDLAWWTMGTQLVLTEPVPLCELYPHLAPGERPFVMGFSVVEAHRNYPAGDVEQIAPLQEEINAVANQRLDNVRLVLNKRYFIRRGSQMDLDALMRNVAGGAVMTNDPVKDVQIVNTPDVTSSSYQEQDRLTQDLDELVGGFGAQAAQSAGKMVDRSGSLDQIAGASGAVQDYAIRIFWTTWMEPVLAQMVKMEQKYETDSTILAIAGKQSPYWERYGENIITDEYIQHNLLTNINCGLGNTDPVKRVQKFVFGIGQVLQLPQMAPRAKSEEISDEIMGMLGYKDSSRFFMNDQELAQHQKTNPMPPPPEIQLKMQELAQRKEEADQRNQRETRAADQTHEWRMKTLQQTGHIADEKLMHQTGVAAGKNKTARDVAAAKESNRLAEINLKRADSANKPPPRPPIGKGPPK